jgi:hypothetical protein
MQRPSGRGVATTPEREREGLATRVRSTSFGYTCRTFVLDLSRRQPWGSSSLARNLLHHGCVWLVDLLSASSPCRGRSWLSLSARLRRRCLDPRSSQLLSSLPAGSSVSKVRMNTGEGRPGWFNQFACRCGRPSSPQLATCIKHARAR